MENSFSKNNLRLCIGISVNECYDKKRKNGSGVCQEQYDEAERRI